ncbi:MAG: DUF1704 domain-containing protein [Candidatus Gracilibacteria bacterium]|nr:DUF1704 domain-containing protein [Candidatus Gracilibacteria bacterium]
MKGFLEYTKDVQNTKSGFASPMGGILKYIQNEDGLNINQDFFGGKNIISQNDIDELLKTFDKKLSEIKNIKKELKDSSLQEVEKKFILNSLNGVGLRYMIFKSSIFLEAEKSGFELTEEQRNFYLRRVNKLQTIVYGPEISSIKSEKSSVLKELSNIYETNNLKLDEGEKKSYLECLKTLGFNGISATNNFKKGGNNNKLVEIFLSKEKVVGLFEMLIDLYELKGWSVFVDDKVGNFSIKKEKKQIILPESKLEKTSLKRILELFDHEVGVHMVRGFNSSKTLNTNGDGYLEAEEGMATLTELMFDEKIEDISVSPTIHHITTYVAENFDFDNTIKFLELYYKLLKPKNTSFDDIKKEALDRTLRVKRFVSMYEKGANRKDVSYTRGQTQVVEYFQNNDTETRGQFLKDFYFAKLSFEDIGLVKEFRESLGIDESELKYPLWIGKILYKKLLGEEVTLAGLKEEDFRFEQIEKLSIGVKKKVVKILQEIRGKKGKNNEI